MAKITYDGMELEEQLYSEPTIINDSREAIVWNDYANKDRVIVLSYDPRSKYPVRSNNDRIWKHFAFIPEKSTPRRVTWIELAKWCANGNGLVLDELIERMDTGVMFKVDNQNDPVDDRLKVRKWGDAEWHEPTVDYIGLEEK